MLIEKICLECNKDYKVPHYRDLTSKFCSKKCSDKSKKAKNNLICPICSVSFYRKPSHKGVNNCCSYKCLYEHKKTIFTGKNNHQYGKKGHLNSSFKGQELIKTNHKNVDIHIYLPDHLFCDRYGRVLKHRFLIEENYELFDINYFLNVDGKHYLKKEFDVHHIDGNHNNNHISNLKPLTRSEHSKLHNKNNIIKRNPINGRIIGVLKLDKLLENPEEGNQQPIITLKG